MGKLIPRLEQGDALRRFLELDEAVKAGRDLTDLVLTEDPFSAPNPTGGVVIKREEIESARSAVLRDLRDAELGFVDRGEREKRILLDAVLGRALDRHFPFIQADAGHNEVWIYLSLMVFPDVVLRRWPPSTSTGRRKPARRAMGPIFADESSEIRLPRDRWIGQGGGRDRNYLRTQWRRWRLFGDVLLQGRPPLGEDELVGLTERSSMARNESLAKICADTVLKFETLDSGVRLDRLGHPLNRSDFARLLGRAVVLETGPRVLDILSWDELAAVVERAADSVMPAAVGRWPAQAVVL